MKLKFIADIHISPVTIEADITEGVIVSIHEEGYRIRKLPIGKQ